MNGWGVELEDQVWGRREVQGQTVKIKVHLRDSMESQYNRNFLKYIHI